jgi:hypothetical protein
MMKMMLETIIFYLEMLCAMSIGFFCGYGIDAEIDRERKKEEENNRIIFILFLEKKNFTKQLVESLYSPYVSKYE